MGLNPDRGSTTFVDEVMPEHWGLAALVTSATLLVCASITVLVAAHLWSHGDRRPHVVLWQAWLARLAMAAILGLVVSTIAIAIRGLVAAGRRREPRGLAVGAIVLTFAATATWVVAGIALLETTEARLLLHG